MRNTSNFSVFSRLAIAFLNALIGLATVAVIEVCRALMFLMAFSAIVTRADAPFLVPDLTAFPTWQGREGVLLNTRGPNTQYVAYLV